MDVAKFQAQHGAAFASIVNSPVFQEAMAVANAEMIKEISSLTPQQIKEHGSEYLALFKGRLDHETALVELSVPAQPEFSEPEAEYAAEETEEVPRGKSSQTVKSVSISDDAFLQSFQRDTVTPKKELTTKEKRQANAKKAREARAEKQRQKNIDRLANSTKK